ncbi:MAG: hypothetical protein PUA94_00910 [Bacteroidales bacterium]|nr:hypothetical protein [Bacteroidales bacterium]
MKMAAGNTFNIDYNFYGMMPIWAKPHLAVPFAAAVPDGIKAYALNSVYKNGDKTVIQMKQVKTLAAGHPYVPPSELTAPQVSCPVAFMSWTAADHAGKIMKMNVGR